MFTFESLPPTTKYESCDRVESLQQHRFINICRWHNTHDSPRQSFTRRSILFIDILPQLSPQIPNMEIMFYELKLNGLNYWNYEKRSFTINIVSFFVWKNDVAHNTLSRAHVSRIPKQWGWSITTISRIDDSKWGTQKSLVSECWGTGAVSKVDIKMISSFLPPAPIPWCGALGRGAPQAKKNLKEGEKNHFWHRKGLKP